MGRHRNRKFRHAQQSSQQSRKGSMRHNNAHNNQRRAEMQYEHSSGMFFDEASQVTKITRTKAKQMYRQLCTV
jgi:hypothetical protein